MAVLKNVKAVASKQQNAKAAKPEKFLVLWLLRLLWKKYAAVMPAARQRINLQRNCGIETVRTKKA